MDERQKKLIEEQMQQIPKEVAEAINQSDWERVVFNIGRKHKLHMDQIDVLSVETILTMIGLVDPIEYVDVIEKRLGLDEEKTMDIVEDVNNQLFYKIRDALKKVYRDSSADSIMADDEKDIMHNAGIALEGYNPKKAEDVVSQGLEKEKVSKTVLVEEKKDEESFSSIKTKPEDGDNTSVSFDPYREPIE